MNQRQIPGHLLAFLVVATACKPDNSPAAVESEGRVVSKAPVAVKEAPSSPRAKPGVRAEVPPGERCPERMVYLGDIDSCIDRYEARIVDGRAEPAKGVLPAEGVNRVEADRACRNAGLRLCWAREWVRACGGAEGRAYPYGDEYQARRCNTSEQGDPPRRPAPGGSFEGCRTPEGVFDLSGNVAEWVLDLHPTGELGAIVGGTYGSFDFAAKCEFNHHSYQPPEQRFSGRGFRCCL